MLIEMSDKTSNKDFQLKILVLLLATILLASCSKLPNKALVADSGYARSALQNCKTDLRYLNQVLGWQARWPSQWQAIANADPAEAEKSLQYWASAPHAIRSNIEELLLGIQTQQTAPQAVVLRIHQQLTSLKDELAAENSKYLFTQSKHPQAIAWNVFINKEMFPAIKQFTEFIQQQYLPNTSEAPALFDKSGNKKCFAQAATWWTSLVLPSETIEQIGWRYLNQTRAELSRSSDSDESLEQLFDKLRNINTHNKTSSAELITLSTKALHRAKQKIDTVFLHNSTQALTVVELPQHLQAAFPAGHYTASRDKTTAARYVINPSRPDDRRLMAEVIAFHEGVPGHHLWASYPRDGASIPSGPGHSGLAEGWAIYSEYVADELGLYSSNYDRQGMMAKHLWAASRLIVEPGLQLHGWSRQRAIDFMKQNTLMSATEIELEVDRYIAMPGQSLSYILGANIILSERERARQILGRQFDIKQFHHVVLEPGLRSLAEVQADIRKWVNMKTTP